MGSPHGLVLGYNDVHPFAKVNIKDRASMQELLATVLDPLDPFFSPLKAGVRCPGGTGTRFDQTASEIEGLCRPLWGLAFCLAGGGEYHGTEWWVQGIKAGTDPESPEFWGYPRDNDQRMVEMCPLGYALAAAPTFWQSLTEREKKNVEDWLGNSINEKNMPNTNWLWFRVFANLGLKKNGAKFSQARLDSDIKHLDTFYRGDGWSNDGPEGIHQMDYYSHSFAIQLIQLLYAQLAGDDDPGRALEFRRRARDVALDLLHYYDDEGRAVPFGRSISYRFAMVSFWGALAYAGVELPAPLTWGMVKGIVLRHFRWWQTQPGMWTSSGTLSLGYSYPCMYLTENYNSPGSPYWAACGFSCLAAPADHPFWTSSEEPLPRDDGRLLPPVRALPHPKHIATYLGGHRMLLSSGQACGYPMKGSHAKYGAFAYSSAFGYSVPTGLFTLEQHALASQLGLSDDDGGGGGEVWRTRRLSEYAAVEYRGGGGGGDTAAAAAAATTTTTTTPVLVSVWRPYADVEVRTLLVPPAAGGQTPNWHLRVHRIDNSRSARTLMTADGSFAIRNESAIDGRYLEPLRPTGKAAGGESSEEEEEEQEGTRPRIIGSYDVDAPAGWSAGREGSVAVCRAAGCVGARALEEETTPAVERRANLVNADPNSNCMESRTVIPTLQGTVGPGQVVWYVTGIYAAPAVAGKKVADYLEGWGRTPEVPLWLRKEMAAS